MNAPGTFSKGPFNPEENLLGAIITHLGCNPSYCYCKDDPEKEIDLRPQVFSSFLDLCPRNELNRCLCSDGKTKMNAPFDIVTTMLCQPKRCKCNGSDKGLKYSDTIFIPLISKN